MGRFQITQLYTVDKVKKYSTDSLKVKYNLRKL